MAYVYILQSDVNNRYYIGSTTDLENRIEEHNSGKSRSTRFTKPFRLVFSQKYLAIEEAKRIEYRLKRFKSRKILDKIIKEGKIRLEI